MSRVLTLYSRAGCHLCEVMHEELQPYIDQYRLNLKIVDIDSDDDLLRRYAVKIPVLVLNGETICQYRLDPGVLSQALKADSGN
ncbi:MAG: glutaredoxin family protein [Gammaproteobacteria bacterium]|nr:glutaredoxin family protein [Gammaproteobacteria bacterium]